jgi:hypothetical protein
LQADAFSGNQLFEGQRNRPSNTMRLNSDRGHYVGFAVAHGAAERKRPSPLSLVWPSRCELLLVRWLSFFQKKRRWCGAIFLTRSQRRSRWSMVGWSTGTRMVAVGVAIAHRGPKDVAGWSMVGGEGRGGSGLALTSIDDAQCRPARAVGLRDTLLPISGTVALTTARPRGGTAAMTHTAGRMSRSPRPVRGVLGGITGRAVDGPRARKGGVGLRRVRCRFVVEIGPPERQAVSERAEDQTAARLVSED